MERWPFITVASSPGEGLSQTPAGLGGSVETHWETESVCVLLQHVSANVFSRWTHTGSRLLTSVLSLQLHTRNQKQSGWPDVRRTAASQPQWRKNVMIQIFGIIWVGRKKIMYQNYSYFKFFQKSEITSELISLMRSLITEHLLYY